MGYFYFGVVRCQTKWAAYNLAARYQGQAFVFTDRHDDETVCRFHVQTKEADKDFWVNIVPTHITGNGISSEKEARRANEFCNVMYGLLRNESFFDYALLGVEVEEFRTLDELKEELTDQRNFSYGMDGLVISKEILKEFPETAKQFEVFSDTHLWIPKISEIKIFADKNAESKNV